MKNDELAKAKAFAEFVRTGRWREVGLSVEKLEAFTEVMINGYWNQDVLSLEEFDIVIRAVNDKRIIVSPKA